MQMLMKRKRHRPFFISLTALLAAGVLLTGCGAASENQAHQTPPDEPVKLYVLAAASLSDAMKEVKTAYEREHQGVELVQSFGSSGTLQQQIEQGAPADLFLSAGEKQMNALEQKGLIDPAYRQSLVSNRLVLVTAKGAEGIDSFADLTRPAVFKVAIGHPDTVPAGAYAKELLNAKGLWSGLQDKLLLAKDVRQVLTYVETGNVSAGIVYESDALSSEKVSLAAVASPGDHSPVTYPYAVLKNTRHAEEAQALYDWLKSPEAMNLFTEHGFQPAAGSDAAASTATAATDTVQAAATGGHRP